MSRNTTQENRYLSVKQILSEAITFCTENQSSIFNSLKYPGLGILLLSLIATEEFGYLNIPLSILDIYFYFIFTIKCHRLFLLNESHGSFKEALFWDKRNTTFMFTSFALALGIGVILVPIILFTLPMGHSTEDNSDIYFFYIFAIPFGYLFSRLSLVLPAIAIDEQNDFKRAWLISNGNGWKLFFLILVIPLTTSFIFESINNEQILFKFISALLGILVLIIMIITVVSG